MGMFSKLRGTKPANHTLAKDVMTPAVVTMYIDGSVDNSEIDQLINLLNFSPIFAQVKQSELQPMVAQIMEDLKSHNGASLVQSVASRLPMPMRQTALLFAMRIALADGRLDDSEKAVLFGFAEAFGITPEQFSTMFEVIAMLQHRPVTV